MECDLSWLIGTLTTVGVLITAASVSVGIAAALNAGFFSAPGAPAPMVVASVTSGIAAGMLGFGVRNAMDDFFRCMGSPPECLQLLTDLQSVIAGLATVLLAQAVAAGAAAAVAWIPGVAQPAMWAILGAFLLQIGLIPTTIGLVLELIDCTKEASVGITVRPLVVTTIVISGLVVSGTYLIRKRYSPSGADGASGIVRA